MELEIKHLDAYPKGKNGVLCKLNEFGCESIFDEAPYSISKDTYSGTFYISKIDYLNEIIDIVSIQTSEVVDDIPLNYIQLVLRPVEDLTKELFMNCNFGFIPAKRLTNEYLSDYYWGGNSIGDGILDKDGNTVNLCFIANEIAGECPYMIYNYLCEWHFDVFNLIPQGLAVDINTINHHAKEN